MQPRDASVFGEEIHILWIAKQSFFCTGANFNATSISWIETKKLQQDAEKTENDSRCCLLQQRMIICL